MNFNCYSLNEMFCVDGPEYLDVDDTPIYANTGWGKKGWNHTDEAKQAISKANKKYTLEEKLQKLKESRERKVKRKDQSNKKNGEKKIKN